MRDEQKSKVELIEELRRARRRLEDAGLDPAGSAGDANESAPADPKLTETLNQLTNILNSMTDMVFVKDLKLRTVWSNEAFAAAVGKTPAETVGNTDIENGWDPELVHGDPDNGIRGFERDDSEALSGKHVHNPCDPANVGDEIRFFDTHKIPLRDTDGNITGVLGIARDVTDNKRAEDERKVALEQLRATLKALPDIMFEVDRDGRIYDYHAPDIGLLAVSPESFLNRNVSEVLPQEAALIIGEAIAEAAETGLHRGATYCLAMGTELRWYELSIAARGTATPAGRFVALVREITERKRTEQALVDADRRKDEFLAVLGHELRNPLAPIRNAVHVLERQDESPDRVRWAADTIRCQSEHLEKLVNDLLDVARITSGRIRLHVAPVTAQDALENALQVVSPLVEARGQRVQTRLPKTPIATMADPVRLTQIFTNLLDNAAKYSDDGGRIEVSVDQNGNDVVIRIRDNGIGIRPEDLPHLFDAFFRAEVERKENKERDGLGLGLPLAKQLTERHGGTLACHSDGPGKGSEFVVTLPIHVAAEASASPTNTDRDPPTPAQSRRILVVDDNPRVSDAFKVLLEVMGHEVRALNASTETLEMIREWNPDVVFLEIAMPVMDGYEVAAAIHAAGLPSRPLLIALTGFGEDSHGRRAEDAGFDHHLLKPADPNQIEALLERLDEESAPE